MIRVAAGVHAANAFYTSSEYLTEHCPTVVIS
jgi:hypothetical protein